MCSRFRQAFIDSNDIANSMSELSYADFVAWHADIASAVASAGPDNGGDDDDDDTKGTKQNSALKKAKTKDLSPAQIALLESRLALEPKAQMMKLICDAAPQKLYNIAGADETTMESCGLEFLDFAADLDAAQKIWKKETGCTDDDYFSGFLENVAYLILCLSPNDARRPKR